MVRTIEPEVTLMKLPQSFPHGTEFLDVDGVPVTVFNDGACYAWDMREDDDPRTFPLGAVTRDGDTIAETEFRAMVAAKDLPVDHATVADTAARRAQRRKAGQAAEMMATRTVAAAARSSRRS